MIKRIVENGCCVGCGLCSSVLGEGNCRMHLADNGFYYPKLTNPHVDDGIVKAICPGIRVQDNKKHGVWGHVENVAEAWSTDKELRFKAASGGVSSALALYLLDSHKVDAVLQVGVKDGSFLYNTLKISRTRVDIMKNAQSRYAPALTLSSIVQILESTRDSFAFIGKPCDIAGIRNLQALYPQYKERIKYCISIFCAGMPSYNASRKTWEQSGRTDSPVFLKYRGEGWPGNFKAKWSDGQTYEISYNDSWGKVLGRNLGFRCKICPDGIGMLADISVGDSWNTKNGYPDFTEADGRNFCFIRTKEGNTLFKEAAKTGYIEQRNLDVNLVKDMQTYQFDRRHHVGWRIIATQLISCNLLKFKGLGMIKLAYKIPLSEGLIEFKGTLKRCIKNLFVMKKIYNNLGGGYGVIRNFTLVTLWEAA